MSRLTCLDGELQPRAGEKNGARYPNKWACSPASASPCTCYFNKVPCTHTEIWKKRFHCENKWNVFRPRYAGEISKRNNHMPVSICVEHKCWPGSVRSKHFLSKMEFFFVFFVDFFLSLTVIKLYIRGRLLCRLWLEELLDIVMTSCLNFQSTLKRKSGVFKFLRFEGCFRKAPFSWQISVDDSPRHKDKAAFLDFFGVVMWTELKKHF